MRIISNDAFSGVITYFYMNHAALPHTHHLVGDKGVLDLLKRSVASGQSLNLCFDPTRVFNFSFTELPEYEGLYVRLIKTEGQRFVARVNLADYIIEEFTVYPPPTFGVPLAPIDTLGTVYEEISNGRTYYHYYPTLDARQS